MLAAGLIALSALLTAPVQSQASPSEGADKTEYMTLVRKALSEYDLGHFREAKAYFEQAHDLKPSARTLRGLGLTSYELRHYVEAISYMELALGSDVKPLNETMRKQLDSLIAEARLFVARVTVTLSPATARLRVDGHVAKPDDTGLLTLDAGRHEFVASAEGHESITRSVEVEGGQEVPLTFTLKPEQVVVAPPPPAPTPTPAPEPVAALEPQPEPEAQDEGGEAIAPWLLIGGGAAVAITGGILTALAFSDIDKVEGAEVGSRWSNVSSAYDRSPVLSGVGIALITTGLAGAAVGAVWKLQTPQESAEPQAWVQVTPFGASAGGHF